MNVQKMADDGDGLDVCCDGFCEKICERFCNVFCDILFCEPCMKDTTKVEATEQTKGTWPNIKEMSRNELKL